MISFYLSHIVVFNGNHDNKLFPKNQLVIWDDYGKKKLGVIILTENIVDFRVSKTLIYITVPEKILIFELMTLQYLGVLEDVDLNMNKISFSIEHNPNIVAYGSWSNSSSIKISKCKNSFIMR